MIKSHPKLSDSEFQQAKEGTREQLFPLPSPRSNQIRSHSLSFFLSPSYFPLAAFMLYDTSGDEKLDTKVRCVAL